MALSGTSVSPTNLPSLVEATKWGDLVIGFLADFDRAMLFEKGVIVSVGQRACTRPKLLRGVCKQAGLQGNPGVLLPYPSKHEMILSFGNSDTGRRHGGREREVAL